MRSSKPGLAGCWSVSSNGLRHLEHGGRNSFDICVLSRMQMRLTAQVGQRQNCGYPALHGCPEISLVEPQKPAGQLPQVISGVTDRQFAGLAERVRRLPPKGRDLCSRGALHG